MNHWTDLNETRQDGTSYRVTFIFERNLDLAGRAGA